MAVGASLARGDGRCAAQPRDGDGRRRTGCRPVSKLTAVVPTPAHRRTV